MYQPRETVVCTRLKGVFAFLQRIIGARAENTSTVSGVRASSSHQIQHGRPGENCRGNAPIEPIVRPQGRRRIGVL